MQQRGTLTMLLEPEPPTLVALTNCGDPSMFVSAKVTEGLLAYDFDLTPRPQLATAWSVSPDRREFTFRLRRGVRWHDGVPFTSHDVASAIALLRDLHGRGRTTFANVIAVRTPSSHTVVIELSQPAPFLLYAFAASESPITPAHLYNSGDASASPNGAKPIGTGPFVFREWVKGSHVAFERNPHYWDSPKPHVDQLVVRFIESPQEKLAAIETGTIDLAPGTPVPLDAIRRIKANPNLSLVTDGYQYTNQVVRLEFNLDHPILGRRAIRQAIAHTIDRQTIFAPPTLIRLPPSRSWMRRDYRAERMAFACACTSTMCLLETVTGAQPNAWHRLSLPGHRRRGENARLPGLYPSHLH